MTESSERLWLELTSRDDRACADQPGRWMNPGGKRQRAALEQICATCPALRLCQEYANSLERWQKQGTLAGVTYREVCKCPTCGEEFTPRWHNQLNCSNRCKGKRKNVT